MKKIDTGSALCVCLADDQETVAWGRNLGQALTGGGIVFLNGPLGAGKTTLSRGILRSYGFEGAVKSPTYTIIEPYELPSINIYHFDLYRLVDPDEWEYLGFDDYFSAQSVCLVEWPSHGEGWLPACDVNVTLELQGEGRRLSITANSPSGEAIVARLRKI